MTNYVTLRPMRSLPRLLSVVSEEQDSPSYHHEGRFRRGEGHCLFKYTLSGEGCFRDAAGEYRLPAGTGFLCQIRDPETAYYYPPNGHGFWRFVYLCFDGPAAVEMTKELLERYGPVYSLPLECEAIDRLRACRSKRSHTTVRETSAATGAALVMNLLLALGAAGEEEKPLTPAQQLAQRARKMIETHVADDFNVSDLAGGLDVSREHLTRVFQQELGVSPYRYILRQKMLLACQLLKETDLSVKEVALRLGYRTPAHFGRTFGHVMHMPPTRFRAVGTVPVA